MYFEYINIAISFSMLNRSVFWQKNLKIRHVFFKILLNVGIANYVKKTILYKIKIMLGNINFR